MPPISDTTMQALEYALGALARRAEVTAHNVANAEVPNFRAARLAFEDQLRRALERGRVGAAEAPRIVPTGAPPGANGNNVVIEQEVIEMMKTNLLQSAMVEAFNYKAGLLRSAIQGSR
ncbi:MAG TPA: hypothetical protein ENK55_08855 [Actinobacteria bacterium]|nr:hypothetical protein [Actinomycetota bacterium]